MIGAFYRWLTNEDYIDKDPSLKVNKIKRDICALGEVNVGAIAEYERLGQRYEFLISQQKNVLMNQISPEHWCFDVGENGELSAAFLQFDQNLNLDIVLSGSEAKCDIKCAYLSNNNNKLKTYEIRGRKNEIDSHISSVNDTQKCLDEYKKFLKTTLSGRYKAKNEC